MKILILGGNGFIGRNLLEAAREENWEVEAWDNTPNADKQIDIGEIKPSDIEKFDRVFHCAGLLGTAETFSFIQDTIQVNILKTLNIFECIKETKQPLTYITLANQWLNPYSITKNCAKDFALMYNQYLDTKIQIAVTYNCFGKYQKLRPIRKIIPYFMECLINDQPIELFGDGHQLVDLVYAYDLAKELLDNTDVGLREYGTGIPLTVVQAATICAEALNKPLNLIFSPHRLGEGNSTNVVANIPMKFQTDISKAMKITAEYYKNLIKST